MKKPNLPAKGIILPFFDKDESIPPGMTDENVKTMNDIKGKVNEYLGKLLKKYHVNNIYQEGMRKLIPKDDGWLELHFIHGKCVLASRFLIKDGQMAFLVHEPNTKQDLFRS